MPELGARGGGLLFIRVTQRNTDTVAAREAAGFDVTLRKQV